MHNSKLSSYILLIFTFNFSPCSSAYKTFFPLGSKLLCIFTYSCSADEWTSLSRNHVLQNSLDVGACLLYQLVLTRI